MTRTRLLVPLVFILFAACPPPPVLEWNFANEGEDLLFVQGPDGEGLPVFEVLHEEAWVAVMDSPTTECLRACGPSTTLDCPEIALVEPVGVAVPAGQSYYGGQGRIYVLTSDLRGQCLEQLESPTAARMHYCWSVDAVDEAGDPVQYDETGAGQLPAEDGPIELQDPNCDTVEFDTDSPAQVTVLTTTA